MSKTYKIYYDDPYQSEFCAKILQIRDTNSGFHIALDRTCFYPGGGGQPPDIGWLNGAPVIDCYEDDGYIYHVIKERPSEESFLGKIDFSRRYAFMQNHTGEHLLSGLAKMNFGATNVGFHMSERGFTIDFDTPISIENIDILERLANSFDAKNIPVELEVKLGKETNGMNFRSKRDFGADDDVRLVRIGDYDLCACAALHVRNTAEVGIIKIASCEKYKGGVRLTVFCGIDAYWDYSRKNTICREAGSLLSSDTDSIIDALDKLIEGKVNLQKQKANLQMKIFELKAAGVDRGQNLVFFFENNIDVQDARRFAKLAAEQAKIAVVLIGQDAPYKYAISAQDEANLKKFAEAFKAALDGKGGADNGIVKADYNQIVTYLENWTNDEN